MLEIFILIGIARGIGGIAERKGRAKVGYQFLGVGLWILGEILGFVVGVVLVNAMDAADVAPLLIYGSALAGAVVGAVIAFAIVGSLPAIERDDPYYGGPYDRTDVRRPEYRRGDYDSGYGRRLPEAGRPPAEGDGIVNRPAEPPAQRREDDPVAE